MPARTRTTRETTASGPDAERRDATSRSGRRLPERIDLGSIPCLQVLDERGDVIGPEPELSPEELLRVHRAMVLTRKLDQRMLMMQRQGKMGTFAPGLGQEATQIGQVFPLTGDDWYSPSYRSFGAQVWRGWTLDGLMLLWDGFFEGFEIPEDVNDLPFSIVIGSHVPTAVGVGMALRCRGPEGTVSMVNFGDGALSQGPVAEALNFAAVYRAPVVFVCENNGYAISIRTEQQAAIPELVRRGPGFGIPSVRVDGNDVLAMIAASRDAVDRARRGDGPTFIEAVTYRMSVHTTADDPKVYRDDAEVKSWEARCPIARFERYLAERGVLDPATAGEIAERCEQEVLEARSRFEARATAKPREVFDYMFETLPPELERQKEEYLRKLDRKGVE